ncbi:unnamed protein product [Phytomonas sp. Hart1]|nr:unnamed protein product [Phytomonas sp. Hart1]|eukprot:CCW69556.1 unnamed protein product [Phytomonas sp. isolate Hart1]
MQHFIMLHFYLALLCFANIIACIFLDDILSFQNFQKETEGINQIQPDQVMLRLCNAPISKIECGAQVFTIRHLVKFVNWPGNLKKSKSNDKRGPSEETRAEYRRLYRSLLKFGEEGAMMGRCLSVHTPLQCLSYGKRLERLHHALNLTSVHSRHISILFHPVQFLQLTFQRYFCRWNIGLLRLYLRIWNILSDTLVCVLFVTLFILLWTIVRLCNVILARLPA